MAKSTPKPISRIARLRREIKSAGLDALVVIQPVNVRYLSGFIGSYAVLVVDTSSATLITDGRYAEIAEGMVSDAKVMVQPLIKVDDWFRDFFSERGYKSLGFEGTLAWDEVERLKKRTRPSKGRLVESASLITQLRRVKDEVEIKAIARAARIADAMMEAAQTAARPGTPELELSQLIRRAAEDFGGEGESFDNIVASGPNASRPHHHPQKRKLRAGDMITFDLGARWNGYCSDLTRTPALGRLDPKFEKIYTTCLRAQEAALKAIRAGAACRDVDSAAREIISEAGYGSYFNHGTGHGVGLEIHEGPRLNAVSEETLQSGNVVTVEPGIYIPGFGGVRIEDLVVVTDKGCRVLSKSSKTLTILPA
jgi:Xaa-Pro aminopeptidase